MNSVNKMLIYKKNLAIKVLIYVLTAFSLLVLGETSWWLTSIGVFLVNLILCYRYRKETTIFLILVIKFIFDYSYLLPFYWNDSYPIPEFMIYTSDLNKSIMINGIFLFTFFLALFLKRDKEQNEKDSVLKCIQKELYLLYWPVLVAIILVGIFGIDRKIESGYTVSISSFYEYVSILIVFAYYFSKTKKQKFFLLFIVGWLIIQDLVMGGRITSMQLLIATFILFFAKKINWKMILVLVLGGFFGLSIIGIYRESYSLNGFSIEWFIDRIFENLFVVDTSYYAYYASFSVIEYSMFAELSAKIFNLLGFLCNIIGIHITGYSSVGSDALNAGYINVGGGLFPSYAYFWGGIVGVIVLSTMMAGIITMLFNKRQEKPMVYILLTVILAYMPRWYLYTPLLFFRSMFWVIILYGLCWLYIKLYRCNKKIR